METQLDVNVRDLTDFVKMDKDPFAGGGHAHIHK
jgi:hypothetical protein